MKNNETVIKYFGESGNDKFASYVLTIHNINDGYSLDFLLEKVNTWEMSGEISEKNRILDGVIKWDGCSHLCFGDEDKDGYLHLCGKFYWLKLADVLKWTYEEVVKEMEHYDRKTAE